RNIMTEQLRHIVKEGSQGKSLPASSRNDRSSLMKALGGKSQGDLQGNDAGNQSVDRRGRGVRPEARPDQEVTPPGEPSDVADASAVYPSNQTQSEAFKRWFGDSKVVNDQGNPLVVYHGTGQEFSVFNTQYGAYFTSDKSVGKRYSDRAG